MIFTFLFNLFTDLFTVFQSYFKTIAFLTVLIFMCSPITAQTRRTARSGSPAGILITAGKGVGKLSIGDTVNRVFQLYPKLKRSDYALTKGCGFSNLELPGSLMLIVGNGLVAQIIVKNDYPDTTPKTAEKILPGSSAASVKKAYPNAGKSFTKLGETYSATGDDPLIYWVDKNAGIAFEFYTDSSRRRLVNAIHVFAPDGRFLFNDGCGENNDLRELPPFAVKVPEKMVRDYNAGQR